MSEQPNRYWYVCPRGFANEIEYIRVPADKADEVEAWFDGMIDAEFNHGNTHYSHGWTASLRARTHSINWEEYKCLRSR